ncbi:MAG: hypothetical protein F6K50_46045 [Moorea sp. SIO3I7]|nr:hypothetical protein [Moorena sp. SIO3I8]NEO02456.1 hypothetical protein [Moorena sp. SIO3I7]NEO08090.1 hypothetical protein [Moorena sp. SIO3I8]
MAKGLSFRACAIAIIFCCSMKTGKIIAVYMVRKLSAISYQLSALSD